MPDHMLVWIGVGALSVVTVWALFVVWKRMTRGKQEATAIIEEEERGTTATFEKKVTSPEYAQKLRPPGVAPQSFYLWDALSWREREVARLWVSGKNAGEISAELGIGPGTVKTHIRTIYITLDVHNKKALFRCLSEIDKYEKS